MAEYIEREKAARILREEAAAHYPTPYHVGLLAAARAIDSIPAADVRPVVLCRDCVHFIRGKLFGDMVCDYHYLHQYHAEPYEFCSHAEKREGS